MKRGAPLRRMSEVVCTRCGKVFSRRTDQISRRNSNNYCSKDCWRLSHGDKVRGRTIPSLRTGKMIVCTVCGAQFYAIAHEVSEGRRFCSRACWAKNQSDHPTPKFIGSADNSGKNNGRYKDGKRVGTHRASNDKTRESVKDRDGDWCILCGRPPKGLHLHRIRYGSHGGVYEPNNCVQLCGEHHALIHSNKKLWQPALLEYIHRAVRGDSAVAGQWLRKIWTDSQLSLKGPP